MNTIQFSYPKGTSTSAELTKKFKAFRESQKAPTLSSLSKNEFHTPEPVKGVNLFAKDVAMLHQIASSSSPLAEAVGNQEATPEQIIGTLSSALLTLEYVKMQAAYKKAKAEAKNDNEKKQIDATWQEGVKGLGSAYSSIGLKGLGEKNMNAFSTELLKDKNAFNSVVNINNSRLAIKTAAKASFTAQSVAMGNFETQIAKIDDPLIGNLVLPMNLCATPFAQGSFTKHFGHSFSLQVTISLPCVTKYCWGIPCGFGWCTHTYTLASLSYNVDLNVGYKVTCCGGSAWGFASANVCASFLGKQFCAGCTAGIVGAVGIARTPSGGKCIYGLGLTAQLKCTFAGITVLNVSYPFGYSLTGPCPPLPC